MIFIFISAVVRAEKYFACFAVRSRTSVEALQVRQPGGVMADAITPLPLLVNTSLPF